MAGEFIQSPPVQAPDVGGLLEHIHIPSQDEYLQQLMNIGSLQAFALAACGVVYLVYGWKIFKLLVIANAATLGVLLGYRLGMMAQGQNTPIIAGIAGGLLLAALAWPLMKYAISLMGGLAGSFLGYSVWHYVANILNRPEINEHAWAGALIGLITLGLLAFVIFRIVVMIFTSFQGSLMCVSGALALLLKSEQVSQDIRNALAKDSHLLPILIAVPAVIGLALQQAACSAKTGKKKSAEG